MLNILQIGNPTGLALKRREAYRPGKNSLTAKPGVRAKPFGREASFWSGIVLEYTLELLFFLLGLQI